MKSLQSTSGNELEIKHRIGWAEELLFIKPCFLQPNSERSVLRITLTLLIHAPDGGTGETSCYKNAYIIQIQLTPMNDFLWK